MTFNTQPESLASIITDLEARIRRLETYQNAALTKLASSAFVSLTLPFTTAQTAIAATRTNSFTLVRPTWILVVPTVSFLDIGGGTATYIEMQATIETWSFAFSPTAWHSVGSGISDTCKPFSGIVNPGTYTAVWNYLMNTGATTQLDVFEGRIDVYQMSG